MNTKEKQRQQRNYTSFFLQCRDVILKPICNMALQLDTWEESTYRLFKLGLTLTVFQADHREPFGG